MNWLFYVLMGFLIICMINGARKGFFRTAVSMVFMVLVLFLTSWINPYVGRFLRESTPVYKVINAQCDKVISNQLLGGGQENTTVDSTWQGQSTEDELSHNLQTQLIENASLPQTLKQSLLENNNSEIYQILGVDKFSDYLAGYLAYSITNGIGFLLSFTLATVIIKVILFAVNVLTALPGIHFVNAAGGLLLGALQGILWIWVFFIIITVLCSTQIGQALMQAVEGDAVLSFLYDKNVLLQVILSVVTGG